MAIIYNTQPSGFCLGKLLVPFKITGTNYKPQNGLNFTNKITFNAQPVDGDVINMQFGEFSETFTARATPNDSGNEFPEGSGGTMSSYLISVAAAFSKNTSIFTAFKGVEVNVNGNTLDFLPRNPGNKYVISGDATFSVIMLNVPPKIGEVIISDNYSIKGYLEEDEQIIHQFSLVPNSAGEVYPNLNTITLPNAAPLPSFTTARVLNTHPLRNFILHCCEVYGNTPDTKELKASNPFTVVNGGLHPKHKNLGLNPVVDYFRAQKAWFTTKNHNQQVSYQQPQWLTFYDHWFNAAEPLQYMVDIVYTDTTTATQTLQLFTSTEGDFHTLYAGAEMLNLNAYEPSKTIHTYTLYISKVSNSEILAAPITYEVEPYNNIEQYFVYESSLGSWEVMRAHGRYNKDFEINKLSYSTIFNNDLLYNIESNQTETINGDEAINAHTGWHKKIQAQHLADCMASNNVYKLEGINFIKVTIEAGAFTEYATDSALYGFNFNYKHTKKLTNLVKVND